MVLTASLRALAALTKQQPTAACMVALQGRLFEAASSRGYATDGAVPSKKEVIALLDQRDDPEANAAVKAYLRATYKGGKAAAASAQPDETLDLVVKVERKYLAAQVVEYGIQNVSVPLAWNKEPNNASLKRYVAQLLDLGSKAGFESPAAEIEKHLVETTATAENMKEVLARAAPFTSAEYHSALMDALIAVENETNSTVTLDAASPAYKKFAQRVKALATAHKIPWQALTDAKNNNRSEDVQNKVNKEVSMWEQSAAVADVAAELSVIQAEAAVRLDKHLSKTAEQVRSEQAAALAALQKRIESAKGAKWAVQYQQDMQYVQWYDSAVAADPVEGPRATA